MLNQAKFLIVSFDGLRPDLVGPALTPNICRVMQYGATLARHRTIYPSETRSAFPSLVTGTTVDHHGMVGNRYILRGCDGDERFVDSSSATVLLELDRLQGGLMTSPTLGEILAQAGKSFAVLATNTAGTTTLFNHKATDLGSIRLSGHFREACAPANLLADIERQFGSLPVDVPNDVPDVEAQEYITTVFLKKIWPEFHPDVSIVSYGEPDRTCHFHGTASETTIRIIAHCDAQLGKLVDWWEAAGREAGIHLILLSDHGHITGHTRVSVADTLARAGIAVADRPGSNVDAVLMPGHVGAIYVPDRDRARIAKIADAIMEAPWCGPVFTAPGNEVDGMIRGTFSTDLVMTSHDRGPDVAFSFRTDDRRDPFGLVGGTYYDADRRLGLGFHGGLHPNELGALGVVAGPAFKAAGHRSNIPSGICDIVPTILRILGLDAPPSMTGRVLREVMAHAGNVLPTVDMLVHEVEVGNRTQVLRCSRVGSVDYIDGASVEADCISGAGDAA